MKLTALKPLVQGKVIPTLAVMPLNPMATKRQRGRAWMTRRAAVLDANPLCVMCQAKGRTTVAQEVDHIVPLHVGGPDTGDNLQGLCIPCHVAKSKADGSGKFSENK